MTEGNNTIPSGTVYIKITSPKYYNALNLNNIDTNLSVISSSQSSSSSQSGASYTMRCQVDPNSTNNLKINGYINTTDYIVYVNADGSYVKNIDYSYIQYTAYKTLKLPVLSDKSKEERFLGWSEKSSDDYINEVKYTSYGAHTLTSNYTSPTVLEEIKQTNEEMLMIIIISGIIVALLFVIVSVVKVRRG